MNQRPNNIILEYLRNINEHNPYQSITVDTLIFEALHYMYLGMELLPYQKEVLNYVRNEKHE